MIDCPPDFSRTAVDYARHRAGFPPELLDRLIALGVARPGARVVDLGTGTGSLARLFARHGCDVTGVDIAGPLLEQARRLDREAGLQIAYVDPLLGPRARRQAAAAPTCLRRMLWGPSMAS